MKLSLFFKIIYAIYNESNKYAIQNSTLLNIRINLTRGENFENKKFFIDINDVTVY